MPDPSPSTLSPHFSNLVGRRVSFARALAPAKSKTRQLYAVYLSDLGETRIVVRADLPLLGSLAGALIGLPDAEIRRRILASEIEECLRDAIHEVLNVAASVIAPGNRIVLGKIATGVSEIDETGRSLLEKPNRTVDFDVLV